MTELRDYQIALATHASSILTRMGCVYLCFETRVGKTLTALLTAHLVNATDVLFITKRKAIDGGSIQKDFDLLSQAYPIRFSLEIISMDSLHKVTWKPGRVLIFDEAHSFGAYPKPSKRAIMLAGLSRECSVIFLSATPSPESYSQIYHQLWAARAKTDLITPYKNFYHWAKTFVNVKQKKIAKGLSVNDYSDAKIDLIKPYLNEFSIAYSKQDAGFIQTGVKELIYSVPMPGVIQDGIKKIKDGLWQYMGINIEAPTAASVMSKTHQIESGTIIPLTGEVGIIISRHKLPMVDACLAMYKKIAVFYKFIAERNMLMDHYGDRVTENVQEFNADPHKIFISQFLSGREGIDLRTARALVMFNVDHAFLSYEQTKNRICSYERETIPLLIWIFTEGGLGHKIYKVVQGKKNFTLAHFKRMEK